ncbi:uncharacterized protein LOC115628718 [Scaptodrosophila lebanonensis]|uniref:Uncharacterized protein LOC115628718 n=1 Tax=Drosophila lebanonensis TaxID=7225 RepID=A0A6J2TYR7_DROLE|nr:uncharacterized protein LOC115628718 [Scaptodrosophila lebanonensis]
MDHNDKAPLTVIDKLRRFCYIGKHDEPVYVPTTFDLTAKFIYEGLHSLCREASGSEMLDCLSSVLAASNAEHLPRTDESMLVLAVYLSSKKDEKERTLVRAHFPSLVRADHDLFLFVKLTKEIQKLRNLRSPLSHTVCKAVIAWYREQPLDRLLHMWSVASEAVREEHRSLLYRCHYTDKEFDAQIKAALSLFFTRPADILKWPTALSPVMSCKSIIMGIAKVRLVNSAKDALPLISEHSLSYEHVPRNVVKSSELVTALLPTMSYEHLFHSFPKFRRFYMPHKFTNSDYVRQLFDEAKLRASNMQPIRFLLKGKREANAKWLRGVNRPPCSRTHNLMQSLLKKSFGLNKPLGLRIHVTLNLESTYLRKSLNGRWRSIGYLDTIVALSFGYYKSEEQVDVHYWANKEGQLKKLNWTKEMSMDEAKDDCEAVEVSKSKQSLLSILDSALMDKNNTYDLFLVLVPAATRGNPHNSANELVDKLDKYRDVFHVDSKFVIVSLRQQHGSMKYGNKRRENILELCNLSELTPNIINAFALGKFQ